MQKKPKNQILSPIFTGVEKQPNLFQASVNCAFHLPSVLVSIGLIELPLDQSAKSCDAAH